MLELRRLGKRFGETYAAREVSLEIRDGEFFSLLGPSGCGKTTLLRMISGLEAPSEGEIHYKGRRIDDLPPNQRQFNLVFQRYALFPHLSVADNVEFGLKMKNISAPERKRRAEEALSLVKMEGFGARQISTLSGGQGQRVALARALVNRPRVLLLDEPLSALDLKLRQQMQVELMSLQRRLGHAFIFVTHDQEEALTLSDRIAVMSEGRVIQVGTPREIYERPATPFVARFIGTMNSIPGLVERQDGDELIIARGKSRVRVRAPGRPGLVTTEPLQILIRPEKLLLSADGIQGENQLAGTIREMMFQGPFSQLLVEVEGAMLTVAKPSSDPGMSWEVGRPVRVSFSPGDARLSQGESLW